MGARMRSYDWRRSPLGDPRDWPLSLRTTVGILLNSRYPMFLAWGPELALIYNDGYLPVFGDKHPDALGQPFPRVWAEIWDDIRPLVERALAGEPTWSENLQLFMQRRGFPEEVYFTFSYSPVRGDSGGVEGMFCACTETTGEVIGERRLKTLRDLAAVAVEGRSVEQVCHQAAEVVGANPADVPFALIYLNDADGRCARLVAAAGCAAGEPFSPERIGLGEPGVPGWPEQPLLLGQETILRGLAPELELPGGLWPEPAHTAAILPLAGSGHAPVRGHLVLGASPRLPFDERYQRFFALLASGLASRLASAEAYEAERQRAEKLAELDRAKTVFFSNVSHELRTPLTLILAPIADLLDDGPGAEVAAQLELVQRNALRLLKLVNTLLDFSRIEAGRIRAAYQPTDLGAFTRDLASNFRSACDRAGLELEVRCDDAMPPVYVDREMWEKIVLNLISNAFKFTLRGRITVELAERDGNAQLEVTDTGIGIPDSELPRIFDRFHRVQGSGGRTHEGSGIGLAMVAELVKLHGGTVAAESEPQRGTAVTVRIPLGFTHLPPEHVSHEGGAGVVGHVAEAFVQEALRWLPDEPAPDDREPPAAPATQSARVLIADDNADMRGYLARLIRQHWQVETAADGREALELARRSPPDLILTDVMMPKLDGFELLAALRGDERTEAVPVVMVSARAGEEARIEALKAGVDDYLVKPFSARELVARVSAQLALARNARERAEARRREEAAREAADLQRRHLRTLFMQAPAPVAVMLGAEHVVALANEHACRVWGRSEAQLLGRPLFEALPELRGQPVEELLDRVLQSGIPHIGTETRAELDWNGDGVLTETWFNLVCAPLQTQPGRTDGVLVIAFDVTEQVNARHRTNELRREAEQANRAKDEFLAMLGHELRNPLAPILTALELIRLRDDGSFERERSVIERQAKQLVALVDDLLDVSRIARGKIELKRQPVNLNDVVTHAVEMVSPLLEQRRHNLTLDVPDAGLTVQGDAARLTQVVSNLLSNAAKYTEPEGRIELSAVRSADEIVLRVRDNGTGISPDLLPRVFDLFSQERQGIDRSLGGLGLGLTIVRSMVELHGGVVSAASDGPGLGAEFTVRLPALDAEALPDEPAVPERGVVGPPRRVLVVDDNEDAAQALGDFVRGAGHAVRIAYDGPSALRLAESFEPDVVLLDIGLPVMDGYEVAGRLAAAARTPRLIAVTGYGQPAERERARAVGFDAHLVKPIDLNRLVGLLEELGRD
ncbi:MAG TPA: ATP-binding protein [Pseudomonadales bacterium]